jgi:hypothetical protein
MISRSWCSYHLYIRYESGSQQGISGVDERTQSESDVHRACDWASIDNLPIRHFQRIQCPGGQLGLCHPGNTHHDLGFVVATFARLGRRGVRISNRKPTADHKNGGKKT